MLDLARERRELQDGVGARDFEKEICALPFELPVNFSFETAKARADANVVDVIGKGKRIDEPAALQSNFAGGCFQIGTFTDECDAIQAPKALADRHPSLAEPVRAIDIQPQSVGANAGVSNGCDQQEE